MRSHSHRTREKTRILLRTAAALGLLFAFSPIPEAGAGHSPSHSRQGSSTAGKAPRGKHTRPAGQRSKAPRREAARAANKRTNVSRTGADRESSRRDRNDRARASRQAAKRRWQRGHSHRHRYCRGAHQHRWVWTPGHWVSGYVQGRRWVSGYWQRGYWRQTHQPHRALPR